MPRPYQQLVNFWQLSTLFDYLAQCDEFCVFYQDYLLDSLDCSILQSI